MNKIDNVEKDFLWLHIKSLPYFRAVLRAVEAHFYQAYELPQPTLDVGCGDGHFATIAFDRQLDVGVDPWEGPIRQAAAFGGYRSLIQADGAWMPFPDQCFSSALSNSVLEHIEHIDAVLAETARLLKPGAPFLFCVPNPRYLSQLSAPSILARFGLGRLGRAYIEWFKRMSRVIHADMPEVWQMRLEEAGFCLDEWWHYFSPQALHVLEWGHYLGLPSLLAKWVTGRWILVPTRWNLALTMRLVRPYVRPEPDSSGTFTFYIAHKA
jgi:SAM-dependent methyltransferase